MAKKQTKKKATTPASKSTSPKKGKQKPAAKTNAAGKNKSSRRATQPAKRTVSKLRQNKAESNARKKKQEEKESRKNGVPFPIAVLKKRIAHKKGTETNPRQDTRIIKRTHNGRTLKTKDEYLPQEPDKVQELKDKRWVAVIDSNEKNELAVVRLTDEKQKNTTALPTYKKGNNRDTYFKHFVETEDNEGNPIVATKNGKFQENSQEYDLSKREVEKIKSKILEHTKQSSENKRKIDVLHKKDKKKR